MTTNLAASDNTHLLSQLCRSQTQVGWRASLRSASGRAKSRLFSGGFGKNHFQVHLLLATVGDGSPPLSCWLSADHSKLCPLSCPFTASNREAPSCQISLMSSSVTSQRKLSARKGLGIGLGPPTQPPHFQFN